jgi:hypothetical protein
MGFLDKVKRAVTGPIAIDIHAPESFAWTDGTLPVPVTLTNTTDENQQVAEVRAKLAAPSSNGSKFTYKGILAEPFMLAPGEQASRVVEISLGGDTSPAALQAAAKEADLPDVPDVLASVLSRKMGSAPKRQGKHQLSVVVKLADSSRLSNVNATVHAR